MNFTYANKNTNSAEIYECSQTTNLLLIKRVRWFGNTNLNHKTMMIVKVGINNFKTLMLRHKTRNQLFQLAVLENSTTINNANL